MSWLDIGILVTNGIVVAMILWNRWVTSTALDSLIEIQRINVADASRVQAELAKMKKELMTMKREKRLSQVKR